VAELEETIAQLQSEVDASGNVCLLNGHNEARSSAAALNYSWPRQKLMPPLKSALKSIVPKLLKGLDLRA
jgi:hypothetical protein